MSSPITFNMFQHGEDLPLFSQCAQSIQLEQFAPQPVATQLDLIPPRCNICKDTGSVGGKRCWCQTRQEENE